MEWRAHLHTELWPVRALCLSLSLSLSLSIAACASRFLFLGNFYNVDVTDLAMHRPTRPLEALRGQILSRPPPHQGLSFCLVGSTHDLIQVNRGWTDLIPQTVHASLSLLPGEVITGFR